MVQRIKSARILVVDDDLGVRESLKIILMDKYYVSTASSIDEAANSLKIIEPELIFLDIRISKENGLDFLKQMHSRNSIAPINLRSALPRSLFARIAL